MGKVIDYILDHLGFFGLIIAAWLTVAEWQALGWIFIAIISLIEFIKRYFIPVKMTKKRRLTIIASIGLIVGMVVAFATWPGTGVAPWWLVGFIAGPLVNWLHRWFVITVRYFSPKWAAIITGDKRRVDLGGASNGLERRGY